jgi:hypothetical protein
MRFTASKFSSTILTLNEFGICEKNDKSMVEQQWQRFDKISCKIKSYPKVSRPVVICRETMSITSTLWQLASSALGQLCES